MHSFINEVKDNTGLKIVKLGGALAASAGSLGVLINGVTEGNSVKVIAGSSGLIYSAIRTGVEGKQILHTVTTGFRRGRSRSN